MTHHAFAAAVVLAAVLMGCKKSESGPSSNPKPATTAIGTIDGAPVVQTVGASGATVISSDGEMELMIPSGALATNTAITIQPITNTAPNGRRKAYRCLPDGLQFSKDITVSFRYTDDDAAATKPEYMMIAFQNADRNWQVPGNIANNVAGNTISAMVNHFTDFSAFDIMRVEPPELYLKTGQTGEYQVTATGISELNGVLLLTELLERPETWKVNGVTGGNSTVGTIAPNSGNTRGVYTAPATAPATNPVDITAEINFSFVVNGQRFTRGILTAKAFIVGGRYAVELTSTQDAALGTGEVFRMSDHARFTVELIGEGGTVNDIQNSPATFQKIQNQAGCDSRVETAGTGIFHIRAHDVLEVRVTPAFPPILPHRKVTVSFGVGNGFVNPKFQLNCPGNSQLREIILTPFTGSTLLFDDSGQQQTVESNAPGNHVMIKFTPLI